MFGFRGLSAKSRDGELDKGGQILAFRAENNKNKHYSLNCVARCAL